MTRGARSEPGHLDFGFRPLHLVLIVVVTVMSAVLIVVTITSEVQRRAELSELLASETATMNVFSAQREAQALATATERYLAGSTPRRNVQIARATLANRMQIRSAVTGVNPAATDAGFVAALADWDVAFDDPPVGPLVGRQRLEWVERLAPVNAELERQARQIVTRSMEQIRSEFAAVATSAAQSSRRVSVLTIITFGLAVLTALLLTRHIRGTYRAAEQVIDEETEELASARDALASASALDREQAHVLEMVATGAPLPDVLGRIAALVSANCADRPVLIEADGVSVSTTTSPGAVAWEGPGTGDRERIESFEFSYGEEVIFHGRVAVHVAPSVLLTEAEVSICRRGADLATIAVTRDLSSQILVHQATHDALTGLPNRAYVLKRLTRNVEAGHPCAVLFCDLDGFKAVNDALGHGAGDELLGQVAERIRGCVRHGDLVARLGGDEFVVVVDNLSDPSVAEAVARSIAAGLTEPWTLGQSEVAVSVSVGVAHCIGQDIDADELLRRADMAMYKAKQTGRARWVAYDSELEQSLSGTT